MSKTLAARVKRILKVEKCICSAVIFVPIVGTLSTTKQKCKLAAASNNVVLSFCALNVPCVNV